jgi:SAM-dependent methyltransferase
VTEARASRESGQDAARWLERWDRQQTGYIAEREQRFSRMFDVLEALLPARFRAIDLASGPGSLSKRLLERFPRARCAAVDFDPVLLAIGREALADCAGRLDWVEADLRDAGWTARLPRGRWDATLSTTALHWLPPNRLRALYGELAARTRRGGLFLNGDRMAFDPSLPTFRRAAERLRERRRRERAQARRAETWEEWWDAVEEEPRFADLVRERRRRYGGRHPDPPELSLEGHRRVLLRAGFREVGVLWQALDQRVLLAVR